MLQLNKELKETHLEVGMRLYITRHGTTEWNIKKILQGWKDSNLTDEGINRAIRLGERLSDIDFDYIYSSPQNRALETARLIRGSKDTIILPHTGLRELGFGSWEGMEIDEVKRLYPEEYDTHLNDPGAYISSNGGESFQVLFDRVKEFIDEIKELDAKNILLVTHGVTVKALLMILKGLNIDEFSKLPVFTGTALNVCEYDGEKFEFLLEGDTSHIDVEIFDESIM